MKRTERYWDFVEALRTTQDSLQGKIYTAFPGIIDSYDSDAMTCRVNPAIMGRRFDDKKQRWYFDQMPQLLDCPVHFPAGGGVTMTFPIKPGDECLVVIAHRCIDTWWQLGASAGRGGQPQAEFRMHDLSDGFVIAKVWSQKTKIPAPSNDSAQIRTTDGTCYIELKEDGNVNVVTTQNITMTAGQNVTVTAGDTMTLNAGTLIQLTAPDIKMN